MMTSSKASPFVVFCLHTTCGSKQKWYFSYLYYYNGFQWASASRYVRTKNQTLTTTVSNWRATCLSPMASECHLALFVHDWRRDSLIFARFVPHCYRVFAVMHLAWALLATITPYMPGRAIVWPQSSGFIRACKVRLKKGCCITTIAYMTCCYSPGLSNISLR